MKDSGNNACDPFCHVPNNIKIKKATDVDKTLQILLAEKGEADPDCATILASAFQHFAADFD